MVTRKIALLFISLWLTPGYAQSKFERLGKPDAIVLDMRIDESSKRIVAATNDEVQVWNYESKTLVHSWPAPGLIAIALRDKVVAGVFKSGNLLVWDAESGKELMQAKITSSALLCVTWIDSVSVAAGSDDGTIYGVNTGNGDTAFKVKSGSSITAIANSSTSLIAGTSKGNLEMYDPASLTLRKSIRAHKGWIRDIQINDSTGFFSTVSDDGLYKEWDHLAFNLSRHRFSTTWLTCVDVSGSRNSKMIAIGKATGEILAATPFGQYSASPNAIVNKVFFLRNIQPEIRILVATHGSGIQIWDGQNMKFTH